MSEQEQQGSVSDLPEVEQAYADAVRGGFNPQPDPPKMTNGQPDPAGLLLPAIQKVRDAANR